MTLDDIIVEWDESNWTSMAPVTNEQIAFLEEKLKEARNKGSKLSEDAVIGSWECCRPCMQDLIEKLKVDCV